MVDQRVLVDVGTRRRSTTYAFTASPVCGWGTPMTPTSATAGMLGEHLLDLGRVDVEARHDDEVLGPVDEVQVAVVVGHGDVAGAQPAVGGQHPRGRLGVVEVALEHVRALHPDLAGVADEHVVAVVVDEAHLDAVEHLADRSEPDRAARPSS